MVWSRVGALALSVACAAGIAAPTVAEAVPVSAVSASVATTVSAAGSPASAARSGVTASTLAASPAASSVAPETISAAWVGGAAARKGTRITLAGRTSRVAGAVRIDRRVARSWQTVASVPVRAHRTWSAPILAPNVASSQSYRVVWAVGRKPLASGPVPTLDVYRLNTYVVTTRGKVTANVKQFAAQAAETYADARGWKRAHQRFARVNRAGDFTLVLAESRQLPSFSSVCSVQYSCRAGRFVVINQTPWLRKTPAFTGDLRTYRHMVVNHETGHWLGLGHASCPSKRQPAPVMQQQSKGLQGCRSNAWPLSNELTRVTRS